MSPPEGLNFPETTTMAQPGRIEQTLSLILTKPVEAINQQINHQMYQKILDLQKTRQTAQLATPPQWRIPLSLPITLPINIMNYVFAPTAGSTQTSTYRNNRNNSAAVPDRRVPSRQIPAPTRLPPTAVSNPTVGRAEGGPHTMWQSMLEAMRPKPAHLTPPKLKRSTEAILAELSLDLEPEQQALLQTLQQRWVARTTAQKTVTSEQWQKTQERFLSLLVLTDEEREAAFDLCRDERDWAYATCATYWSGIQKMAASVGIAPSLAMKAQMTFFNFMKDEEDPKRPTKAISETQIQELFTQLMAAEQMRLAILLTVAFLLGQRVGDTLKLRRGCLTTVKCNATLLQLVAITFRHGKTTRRRQPYTVHLPADSQMAQALWKLNAETASEFLFFEPNAIEKAMMTARTTLQSLDSLLGILSIRRGGLQKMALDGVSEASLLHHSRHATREMLHKYLQWGTMSLDAARERFVNPQVPFSEPTFPWASHTPGQNSL